MERAERKAEGARRARRWTLGLLALASAATLPLATGSSPSAPPLALRGATLWDGTGAPPVADAVVLIRGERVVCAGHDDACPVPPDAAVLDVAGSWIVPGLVDTHVHLAGRFARRDQEDRFAAGITTTRDASTLGSLERNLRERQRTHERDVPVPRLFVSGRVSPPRVAAFGETDARSLTRRLIRMGVDGIKVKGGLEHEIDAVVQEAHAAGRPVFGHTGYVGRRDSYTERALRAHMDGVVHLDDVGFAVRSLDEQGELALLAELAPERSGLDTAFCWSFSDRTKEDAMIALLVAEGAWLEPTLLGLHLAFEPERFDDFGALQVAAFAPAANERVRALAPAARERAREGLARMRDFVRRFHEAGGTVVAGSDSAGPPGRELRAELGLLEAAGLPPEAVLAAATRDAARALRWQDRIGTLEPGRLGDLVVLDADPLRGAANLAHVRLVVKGGRVHRPAPREQRRAGEIEVVAPAG